MRAAPPVTMLVATIGLTLVLQALAVKNFGNVTLRAPPILPDDVISVGGRPFPVDRLWLLGTVCVLALGVAIGVPVHPIRHRDHERAFLNEKGAILLGLNPARLGLYNWVFASMLAGDGRHHRLVARWREPVQLQPVRRPGARCRVGRPAEVHPGGRRGRRGDRQFRSDRRPHRGATSGPAASSSVGSARSCRSSRSSSHSSLVGKRLPNSCGDPGTGAGSGRARPSEPVRVGDHDRHRRVRAGVERSDRSFRGDADAVRRHAPDVDRAADGPRRAGVAGPAVAGRLQCLHAVAFRHDARIPTRTARGGCRDGGGGDLGQHPCAPSARRAVRDRHVLDGGRLRRPAVPQPDLRRSRWDRRGRTTDHRHTRTRDLRWRPVPRQAVRVPDARGRPVLCAGRAGRPPRCARAPLSRSAGERTRRGRGGDQRRRVRRCSARRWPPSSLGSPG